MIPDPANEFLHRWVYNNPALADRRELFHRWFTDPTPREDIAAILGVPLGQLLRSFNDTAPLSDPVPFTYRGIRFAAVAMAGVCDDVAEGRFPLFGTPVTLRCYLTEPDLLPQQMFAAADWNYMDASLPGFVGYAYGVQHRGTLYLAGLQSDLAVRYSYLFQRRGDDTEIRHGDDVLARSAVDGELDLASCVPTLRRTFQRYWISILLGMVVAWSRTQAGATQLGLLQFPLTAEENQRGHVVHRVYRDLPARLGSPVRCVQIDGTCHSYAVAAFDDITSYLGERFALTEVGPLSDYSN